MAGNMDLWEAVERTDPAMTKRVNQRGGFTAICAQYQIKNATRLWGPFGKTWGLKDLRWTEIRTGNELVEVALDGVFWYPGGEFPISTDIAYRPGNDTRKKLRTDSITKSLSTLGFNSDVFEEKFDDNKYVAEARREFAPGEKPPAQQGPTNIAGWKIPPEQRASAALTSAEETYKARDLEKLKRKLVRLDEIVTDFLPKDVESLRAMITSWVAELELSPADLT